MSKLTLLSIALTAATALANCGNDKNYGKGKKQAEVQWDASFRYSGCEKIESNYDAVNDAAPNGPKCLREGFLDELDTQYDDAKADCKGGDGDCAAGRTEANKNWDANLDRYGDECSSLDQVFQKTNQQSPSKDDCFKDEYDERSEQLYNIGLKNCVNECRGWGYQQGDNLASQFCAIATTYSDDESLVEEICIMEEIDKCKERFYEAVMEDCPEKYIRKNYNFYDDLEESCNNAIGSDQPMPTKKPYPGDEDYQMFCSDWGRHNECTNGKKLEPKTGCCKYLYRCGGWKKCTEINCCTKR